MPVIDQDFSDLLSNDDVQLDEEQVEDEVIEQDPLGLADLNMQPIAKSDIVDSDSSESEDDNDEGEPIGNFINAYLNEHGISDPTKIQMQNENGEVEEVDFNSLSEEDKLGILRSLSDPGYTDYEKQVVNYLRQNNVTLDQVIEYYQNQAIEEYLKQNPDSAPQRVYSIDEYTDDEVYLADLKSKYPDFSDEELNAKLDSAKLNEELFGKEVAAIRDNYHKIEEEEARQQQELEAQSYQELQNNIQNAMGNFTEIVLDPEDPKSDALQIEDEDRELMFRYLTELGKDGKSQLVRDLEDPNALIELAYYRTRERDNLTGLTRYWKNELANERKEKAKLQRELDKYKNKGKNSFVVTTPQKPSKGAKTPTIMDIYGE